MYNIVIIFGTSAERILGEQNILSFRGGVKAGKNGISAHRDVHPLVIKSASWTSSGRGGCWS